MNRVILANAVYIIIIAVMIISGLWVGIDARGKGRPWSETIVWGLFAGWFFGLGPIVYVLWNRKIAK